MRSSWVLGCAVLGCSPGTREANEPAEVALRSEGRSCRLVEAWRVSSDDEFHFAASVAAAGDVNADGFDDLLVGSPDAAGPDDTGVVTPALDGGGAAALYLGSAHGPDTRPAWFVESDEPGSDYGAVVASAGDVNADGFDDVLVAQPRFDNGGSGQGRGRVLVYHGSALGPSTTADWQVEGANEQTPGGSLGIDAATAGDVNGDGFDDIVLAAEDRAFVYLGSATGLSTLRAWEAEAQMAEVSGGAVASAGDVDGDGFDEVLVGSPQTNSPQTAQGEVALYAGSARGPAGAPTWRTDGARGYKYASYGDAVASAGDVNGDGFDDVVIGSPNIAVNEQDEGAAYLYLGSPTGLRPRNANWKDTASDGGATFGDAVDAAGDVNGDGFADVVVGASGENDAGKVLLYPGSSAGLRKQPVWAVTGNDEAFGPDDQHVGTEVVGAGDVDGNGLDDILVGAPAGAFVIGGRAVLYLAMPGCGADDTGALVP